MLEGVTTTYLVEVCKCVRKGVRQGVITTYLVEVCKRGRKGVRECHNALPC